MMSSPQFKPCVLDWSSLMRQTPDWFRDAKFGLFFHWGPYSVPACENEWYSRNMYAKGLSQNRYHEKHFGPLSEFGYKDFYNELTGEKFDAAEWADLTVLSGAKYGGPVSEHSDNFSLWPSRVNPNNSMNYGPKRDILGEYKKAIEGKDIRFIATFHHQWLWGWFMSSDPDADVYHPDNEEYYGKPVPLEACRYIPWQLPDDEFNRVWLEKVKEVVDAYDPALVYFDTRTAIIGEEYRMEMMRHCYEGNSDRVVCYKLEDFPEGSGLLDVERGIFFDTQDFPWQVDTRLEDRTTWCYVEGVHYRSPSNVLHQLIDVVSKNGNLLLNVGPKADGSFAEEAWESLKGIGGWLAEYGEAIYGTRPFLVYGEGSKVGSAGFEASLIEEQTKTGIEKADDGEMLLPGDVRYTRKGNTVYAIVPFSEGKKEISLAFLGENQSNDKLDIREVSLLGGVKTDWERRKEALILKTAQPLTNPHANVFKIITEPR